MKQLLSLVLSLCLLLTVFSACGAFPSKPDGSFTLMVYMVGSDLESKTMAASNDIAEMLDSGYNADKINIVLCTGGSKMWYADVPNDTNATILLTEQDGEKQLQWVSTADEAQSMGEANTLSDFLTACEKNYPATHYGLICWDHGNGPLMGFGKDTLFQGDHMELGEMKKALETSPFKDDKKLDFIGFDACLMSSVEVAEVLRPHARYMIASQETEPGDGWDYAFLSKLNETYDTEKIAESILESYKEHYEEKKSAMFNPDLTLACMDLSKMDAVEAAMDKLLGAMTATLNNGGGYQLRAEERAGMKTFGASSFGSKGWSLDLVDMADFAKACQKDFPDEAAALQDALQQLVVSNQTNLTNAGGISMYYPYDGSNVYAQLGIAQYKSFFDFPNYQSYMSAFINNWSKGWLRADNTVDEQYENFDSRDIEQEGGTLTVKLSDEQKKSFSKAYLNIFEDTTEKGDETQYYIPRLYHKQMQPDADGNIIISDNEKIPVAKGNTRFGLVETAQDDTHTYYKSFDTSLNYTATPITMSCAVKNGSDDILIQSLDYINEENNAGGGDYGKNTLDAERYSSFAAWNRTGSPKRDKNGMLLSFDDWDIRISNAYMTLIDSDLTFKMTPIGSLKNISADKFCYQIEVQDTSGKFFRTELMHFENKEKTETYQEKTSKGRFTYELHDTFAKLLGYVGTDTDLTVPATVKNLPVLKIEPNAFVKDTSDPQKQDSVTLSNPDTDLSDINFNYVKKIVLPDGVKSIPSQAFDSLYETEEIILPDSVERIGAEAFASSQNLTRLELPASVRYIANGAFYGINSSIDISFKGENAAYMIKDNMLLTKDGKKLLAVFGTTNSTLVIPEGVEQIAPETHFDNDPNDVYKAVQFPSTLQKIGYNALTGSMFEELIIPDSVREIGDGAFASGREEEITEVEELTIPISVPKTGNDTNASGKEEENTEFFKYDVESSYRDIFTVKTIQFGKNLSWIGKNILGESTYKTLKVSDSNRFFAVRDNRLTNKNKMTDLSEVALSGYDNLEKNASEYKIYEQIVKGIDLSHYDKAKEKKYNKKYDGKDYCLQMERKKDDYTPLKLDDHIRLDGHDYTLPCKVSELLANGLMIEDGELTADSVIEPEKFGFESFWIKKADGTHASIFVSSDNDKALPMRDCYVEQISIYRNMHSFDLHADEKEDVMFPYTYQGITMQSTVEDVYKALGEPQKIDFITDHTVMLTFKEYAGNADSDLYLPLKKGEIEIEFNNSSEDVTLKLSEISIEYDKEPTYW